MNVGSTVSSTRFVNPPVDYSLFENEGRPFSRNFFTNLPQNTMYHACMCVLYVCMYVCMYVCIVCMYVLYVCMYCMYVCMYVCMYCMYVCMYVCLFQNAVLRCPTPRLHCFLASHWLSFRYISFMTFLIPSIQFFFGLPRDLFCFGIHFNAILGTLPSAILWTWPYHVSYTMFHSWLKSHNFVPWESHISQVSQLLVS